MDIFNEVMGRHMGGQLIPVTRFGSTMQTFTPQWVVKDMIALLPDQVWNDHTTFLDISCKTGIFLVEIFKKLDEVLSKNPKYADTATRRSHILNEQLYGLALDDKECLWYSSRNVYGRIGAKNMKYLHAGGYSYDQLVKNKKVEYMKALIQEEFGRNMFDVVVGNPPYNNDIYLDFVTLAKAIQTQNVCMITPAKWQAKGGRNDQFRADIVPYMSKVVFYPNTPDIFHIGEAGGISYFTVSKNRCSDIEIINRCYINKALNNKFNGNKNQIKSLELCGMTIIDKINNKKINIKNINYSLRYKVFTNNLVGLSGGGGHWETCLFSKDARTNFLGKSFITSSCLEEQTFSGNYTIIFSADTYEECNSFKSYINTRFVRFLMYCGRCGNSVTNKETWRFVPDPGKFDHIFTDQELYEKYHLTDEEINIIESVIKERK